MSAEAHGHAENNRLYLMVWGALLLMTLFEVFLAYEQMATTPMLITLMGLSLVKAGLIIAYFMHLKFEVSTLFWAMVPMWLMVMLLLFVFFPDSVRLHELRFPLP
jgi:cytochrome c oxidase subunit IV